jgi:hypothetical protein
LHCKYYFHEPLWEKSTIAAEERGSVAEIVAIARPSSLVGAGPVQVLNSLDSVSSKKNGH